MHLEFIFFIFYFILTNTGRYKFLILFFFLGQDASIVRSGKYGGDPNSRSMVAISPDGKVREVGRGFESLQKQCCGSKQIEFGSASMILAQFGSGFRVRQLCFQF